VIVEVQHPAHFGDELRVGGGLPGLGSQPADARVVQDLPDALAVDCAIPAVARYSALLQTRERVHDLGVFKALGMTPRQAIAMVVCSVAGIGLVAGLIAVPAGVALHRYVLPVMGNAAQTGLPASVLDVYHAPQLILLALSGLVIAWSGPWPPQAGQPAPAPPPPSAPNHCDPTCPLPGAISAPGWPVCAATTVEQCPSFQSRVPAATSW
jgi:hypothetical protein